MSVAIFGIRPLAGVMGLNVQIFGGLGRSDPAPFGAQYLRPEVEFQKSLRTRHLYFPKLQNDTKYALVGSLMLAVEGGANEIPPQHVILRFRL